MVARMFSTTSWIADLADREIQLLMLKGVDFVPPLVIDLVPVRIVVAYNGTRSEGPYFGLDASVP